MSSIRELELLQARRAAVVGLAEPVSLPPSPKLPPIITYSQLLKKDNNKTVSVRTGLTNEEFDEIYALLEQRQAPIRRGRQLPELKIRLVALLQWIHHGQTFVKLGNSMGLTHSCIQSMITSIWNDMTTMLCEAYIPRLPRDYTSTRTFVNFPAAAGALDATLISIRKPSEREEDRRYFSGKHRKHGVKLQVLVAPDGTCIHYGGIIEGSRNDFYLFKHSSLTHDMTRYETGNDGERIATRPQILADGGYNGIRRIYCEAVIPYKKPPHGRLTEEQREANRTLGQDRVVVERFFGRMKGYWAILQRPYRSDRDSLDSLARIVVALTNLKIRSAPLFSEENIYNPDPSEEEEDSELSAAECQIPSLPQQRFKTTRNTTRKKDGSYRAGSSKR